MSDRLPRRPVLCAALLGVITPGVLVACGTSGPKRTGGVGDAKPGGQVSKASAIPVGGGVLVEVGTTGLLLVVQPSKGTFVAYDPTCPHQGGRVQPPVNGVMTCPLHGSEFNPSTGAVEQGPAARGLTTVAVRLRGDEIVLA